MGENKVEHGLFWNEQIIPNHGGAIPVDGPTPGPDWVGRVNYTIINEQKETGGPHRYAIIEFPWKRIK